MVGTRKDNMARRGLLTSPIKSESKSDGNQSGSALNPAALGGSEQLGHPLKQGIVKQAFRSDVAGLSLSDHPSDALSSSSGDQIIRTFQGFFHEQQRVLESRALKSQERHATQSKMDSPVFSKLGSKWPPKYAVDLSHTRNISICTTQEIDHRVRAVSEKFDDTVSTFQNRVLAACNAQLAETEKLERELTSSVKMLQDIIYHGSRRGMKLKRVTQGIHENCVRSMRASKYDEALPLQSTGFSLSFSPVFVPPNFGRAQLRDRQKDLISRLGKEDGRAKRHFKLEKQRLHALKSVADLLN
ncbi:hypothetical protein NDN08_000113 [Rhodosorus marinus]|uniref:Uncharacterized protein n=1 Tax=Rhodosorus marinus TaxID=101924 RepID=A0AAV8UE88_9RHOD|nr:hypothetical protein NDN08_000113 [Rhodosorus marinus]